MVMSCGHGMEAPQSRISTNDLPSKIDVIQQAISYLWILKMSTQSSKATHIFVELFYLFIFINIIIFII